MREKLCPNCRRPLQEKARFCTECGSRIDVFTTRKELDNMEIASESGLIVGKNSTTKNPFYSKNSELRNKIINPELKPLPEKRKLVFRDWNTIKETNRSEEEIPMEESPTDFEALKGLFEGESAEEEIPEEIVEEVSAPEIDEETIEISETVEATPEIEEEPEEISEEIPEEVAEEVSAPEIEEETIEISETVEAMPEIEEESKEISEEIPMEESPTDFEALKGLFEGESAEEEIPEEVAEEVSTPEIEEEAIEISETIKATPEIEEETVEITETVESKEDVSEEAVTEIEKNLVKNIPIWKADATEAETKKNRIITSPVTGGFKKREPQAEEVKDVFGLFKKKR